ncbi:hypothetical protein DFH09DRAFT_1105424 [Mycena vulgaris]|nr:hypothetical protein DFH09DRAFT_1105424 [Mycena vulgaris]
MRGTDRGLRRLDARGRLIYRGPNEAGEQTTYGGDHWTKARGGNEGRIIVSLPGGPGSKGSENAGERRGNNAWSARWELGPQRRLRACGRDIMSRCAAQGRKKRQEAGKNPKVGSAGVEGDLLPRVFCIRWSVIYAINRDAQSSWARAEGLDTQLQAPTGHRERKKSVGDIPPVLVRSKERASGGGSGGTKTGSAARQGEEGA